MSRQRTTWEESRDRCRQALKLHEQGLTTALIARRMDVSSKYVARMIRRGRELPPPETKQEVEPKKPESVWLAVQRAIYWKLEIKAHQRGVTPPELTNEILLKIVNDDLLDAVLDDSER